MQANAFAARYLAWRTHRYFGISVLCPCGVKARPESRKAVAWQICMITLALLGALTVQALAVANITQVNVANKPDCVVISVQGNEPLKMSALPSKSGTYLGFQFRGELKVKGRLVGVHSGKISNVRYSQYQDSPAAMRIVLNTLRHLDYSTEWNDSKTGVEITVWKFGTSKTGSSKPAETAAPTATPQPAAQLANRLEARPVATILPVLPPAQITGPQGSEPGRVSVKETPAPIHIVRTAAPKPVRVAQATAMPASAGAGKKVWLNFLGADIVDVLKALAVQSGENIVVGTDVTGSITVTLDDVTVEEALDYITQLSGYHYIKDQHTYLVGSTGTVGGLVDAKVEVVTLSYASADDVLEMLKVQCPQIRTSKISVRGGQAQTHKQEFKQGEKAAGGDSGQAGAAGSKDQSSGASEGQDKTSGGNAASTAKPSDSLTEKQVHEKTVAGDPPAPDITKTPSSNMIALVGSAEKVAAAKAFIDQVEEAMRGQSDAKKISIYSAKYVNTWELANTLMSLVLGVNVAIGPSDETGPTHGAGLLTNAPNVMANMMSDENTHRPFVDPRSPLNTYPSSHTLIIVGKPADVQKALYTAAQFDVPGENDLATYKVKYVDLNTLASTVRRLVPGATITGLSVSDDSSQKGGAAGQAVQNGQGSGQGMQAATVNAADVNNLSRTIVITGRKGDVEKAKSLVEALDVKSPQIKIEAKITSLSASGEKKLGLSWNWGKLSVLEDWSAPIIAKDDRYTSQVAVSPNGNVNKSLNRYWRQPLNFGATLEALITNGDGKLLASPSLMCLEGKPSRFFVGDQIRFVTQISVAANGEPTVTTETADVGVQLSVVGSVSSDGYITLNLHPEVSVVRLDPVQASGVALNLPTITRRYTDQVVRVKDGSTIVIGGLINDQEVSTMTKVPLLGDLPVLGNFFKHTNKTKDHSEVVIFINASVVND